MASWNDKLSIAAGAGNNEFVEDCLANGANVNFKNKSGWTPLHTAAFNGHDATGLTPLHRAAFNGNEATVSLLISRGADIDSKDNDAWTPLYCAVSKGHTATADMLITKGADIESKTKNAWTPLYCAVSKGHTATADMLITKGADIESKTKNAWTPLYCAVSKGHTATADMLITKGADIESKTKNGWTPLYTAAFNGHDATVRLLISRGADINCKDNIGWTPLHKAAFNGHDATVSLLISRGADINCKDNDAWTPLYCAVSKGHTATADMLITKGADIESKNKNGWTPLHRTAFNGNEATVSLLISRGADIDSKNNKAWTPLYCALSKGRTVTADMLITKGADIESKTKNGWTPLHMTAFNGNEATVSLLISRGADIDSKNNKGNTPLEVSKNKEIKKLIKDAKDFIKAGLPLEFWQLDKQSASVFTYLQKEGSYELFELRSLLQGEQGTGKSTIARFLVGKSPTKFRISTDGIELYTGLSFFDDETHEWLGGKQGFAMKDITISRSIKYQGALIEKLPVQTKMEMSEQKRTELVPPDEIIYERQSFTPLSLQETDDDILETEREMSEAKDIKCTPSQDIDKEMLEIQIHIPERKQDSSQNVEHLVNKEQLLSTMQRLDRERAKCKDISRTDEDKSVIRTVDNSELSDFLHHRQKFAPLSQETDKDIFINYGLTHQSSEEKVTKISKSEEIKSLHFKDIHKATEIGIKPDDYSETIKNTGIINKLKKYFGIKKEVEEILVTQTKFFNKSKQVAKKKFHKRKVVPVTIWDFGGQDVFYSTHQTFLTYRAVYMLVLDGSRTLNEPCKYKQFLPGRDKAKTQKDYVKFWINTIITYCKGDIPGFPKIMIILTHKDKLAVAAIERRRNEIFGEIEQMFDGSPIKQHLAIEERIFVNARKGSDPEMEKIKQSLIHQAKIQPTWGQKLPKCFLPLELEIEYLVKKGVTLITMEHMKKINSRQAIRPLTDSELKVFLKFQHSVGKILYFDETNLDQHIIISPTYLIDAFKSIITDKQFCKGDKQKQEAWYMMEKKGIILKQAVEKTWKQRKYAHFYRSMEYLLGVMTHLDILVEPRRYDLHHHRIPTNFFYVASMVQKQDTTGYLKSTTFSKRNIAISFNTISPIIPPALSFRFISYCLSIWGVQTYGDDNEEMLFHRSAVLTIDPSLDLHIQCEDDRLIVRLVHERNRTLIMRDLASSIRDCVFAALHKISQLYIRTNSEGEGNIRSFDVKVCCSSPTNPCSIEIKDISDVWTCSQHHIEHGRDLASAWFTEKGKTSCESSCPVTDENFLLQNPDDLHLHRLTIEYEMEDVRKLVTELGLPYMKWKETDNSPLTPETKKFTAFKRCSEQTLFTFRDLKSAAEKQDIPNPHRICKIVRDEHISFDNEPEKWDLVPTDEDIDKLAPLVGNRFLGFLVELGLTFLELEQFAYSQPDLVELNRKIMQTWRKNCLRNNIKPALRTIGQAFENIGINSKNIENQLFD